ncbi:hypothetical protein J2T21_004229, partial [Paeniglutamicibacter psychrophenolicus]|nr:hypothetical protein [Paeniglutamicibacter psychrophenolicus]
MALGTKVACETSGPVPVPVPVAGRPAGGARLKRVRPPAGAGGRERALSIGTPKPVAWGFRDKLSGGDLLSHTLPSAVPSAR